METYRIENLTFTYPNKEVPILKSIDLTIERGEFVVICGISGCGKTTLLRQLKPSIAPHGIKSGAIYFDGTILSELDARAATSKIGFVLQSPDNQIVTDKVWHELAFGLESLGLKTPEIRLRVAEMASFFGIQTWFHKSVTELSGGQKQILALASVMALQPSVLILDEPTSQLDPIAAGEFLATVAKINRELGVTVILTEHRLEEAFPLASRVVVMNEGKIFEDGAPREVGLRLRQHESNMFLAMPTAMRVWMSVANGTSDGEVPITAREGANWLNQQKINIEQPKVAEPLKALDLKTAVELKEVWFKYEKSLPDVVKGLDFKAHYGEITAILGGNGTGKTTTLSLIADLNKPYRGTVFADTKVYALPQNPQSLFVAKTVQGDLLEILSEQKLSKGEIAHRLVFVEKLCRLEGLLESHPYDLSGGEQQRAALAKVLLLQPKILLLDEPTKGLDAEYKQIFAAILRKLTDAGVAIVLVSHDVEFCAEYADRCSLFFDGNIVTENTPRDFFSGNSFYTTTANRMARHILPDAITTADVVLSLGGKMPAQPEVNDLDMGIDMGVYDLGLSYGINDMVASISDESSVWSGKLDRATDALEPFEIRNALSKVRPQLPQTHELFFLGSMLLISAAFYMAWVHRGNLFAFVGGGPAAVAVAEEDFTTYLGILLAFIIGTAGIMLSVFWKREDRIPLHTKRPLSKRTIAAAVLTLLTIPLTIYIGVQFFDDRRFYFISMLIILQTMLPFMLVFEGRKPQARETIVIAVLCAIAVAGRSAFFMLPQFKPVVAMVIIAGVAFGGESGFLVGAMTGFVSNMFFGQGPWTPWQMFAFGVIGFLAGILFRKGLLRRSPMPLAIFGGIATFIIYGGIMNPASVIMWQPNPTREMILLAYLHGIPFDIVHAAATVFFLITISRPMLEKLDRIKVKYGLVE